MKTSRKPDGYRWHGGLKAIALLATCVIAAALAAVWVGLSMAQVSIEYWKLNRVNEKLDADIEQVFRRTFPEVKNVVNARVQMEQRIKELTSTGDSSKGTDFLKLLHHTGVKDISKKKGPHV